MPKLGRRRAFARLAAASMVIAGSSAASAADSSQLRNRLLSQLGDDAEFAELDANDAEDSAHLESGEFPASSPDVATLWPEIRDATFKLLRGLANDPAADMRAAAGHGLARALQLLAPVERIELACQWALSERWGERAAVAQVLASPLRIMVTDLIIEQLSHDERVEVRAAALQAAQVRLVEAPEVYIPITARLKADPVVYQLARASAVSARIV